MYSNRRSCSGRANILINPTGRSQGSSIDSLDKLRNRALDTEKTTSETGVLTTCERSSIADGGTPTAPFERRKKKSLFQV
ncbi:hypothetical protein AVEN_9705-1 [Araneus ventricosus]|uniref:Uncharacterized protein n=1 Tax=Araneus ventricosus TaxID=182803 RepID=A0A4Y2DYY1_ARAVE|nr:hypothetical protein AVEN_9705-1 [Araneus ventricosus]